MHTITNKFETNPNQIRLCDALFNTKVKINKREYLLTQGNLEPFKCIKTQPLQALQNSQKGSQLLLFKRPRYQ